MDGFFSLKTFARLLAAGIVLAAAVVLFQEWRENSQSPQTPENIEVTRIVERTVLATTIVERVITATPPAATATPDVTATPAATPTPAGLAVLENGLEIWCMPVNSYQDTTLFLAGEIPEGAISAQTLNDRLTVITQVKNCTFKVAFNSPMPAHTRLILQDFQPKKFIDEELTAGINDSASAYLTLDHYFVINPPYWETIYTVSVIDPDGQVLWEQPVTFRRSWVPDPCPSGYLPDINTGLCQ